MNRRSLSITPRGVLGTIIVAVVAATCIRLGFWQLERRSQRSERNAYIETRLEEPAIELHNSPGDTAGWLYRYVIIAGLPDSDRAIVLPGRLYRGAPGAHVLVPVQLAGGTSILVDLGWVPAADGATVDFAALGLGDPVTGNALVKPFPGDEPGARRAAANAGTASGDFRRVWYSVDSNAIREQFPYDLGAISLQMLPGPSAAAYPVRQEPPALDPGPHLGYAIQWFSFATIAVVGWMAMVIRSGAVQSGGRE